jgi:hypothetical protein
MSGQHHALATFFIVYGAGWTPELVWIFWRRVKGFAPVRIYMLDHPACPIRYTKCAIPTMLSCLLN